MGQSIHLITYLSDCTIGPDDLDTEIGKIVKLAKKENARRSITGVLFHVDGKFLQVIEGKEFYLRQLMLNIKDDPRHGNIEYIIDTPVETRGFDKWNMDAFQLGRGKTFDAETLRRLTENFKQAIMPQSKLLTVYYKALLKEGGR